jgi:transglutaminase-like putative cysteine protease
VSSSFGELYLLPRDVPGQVCRSAQVLIEPEPHDYRQRHDFYGNQVAYFAVLEPHARLTVTAESTVDVRRPATGPSAPPGRRCSCLMPDG